MSKLPPVPEPFLWRVHEFLRVNKQRKEPVHLSFYFSSNPTLFKGVWNFPDGLCREITPIAGTAA